MIRRIFVDPFHREQQQLLDHPPRPFDRKTFIILLYIPVALSVIRYYGDPAFVANILADIGMPGISGFIHSWAEKGPHADLHHLQWWVGTMITCYLVIPALIVKIVFREKLSDNGLRFDAAFHDWQVYVVMLVIMLPLVYFFSSTASFQKRYPFLAMDSIDPDWHDLFIWEIFYFSQFIALEFFFRGFVTLGLRHRFGYYSIFVMMIPYCMIHFGKPMPETIGAIFAGLILGTLSMKSRSVFLGVLIHYSIAISMDLFSLWRKGFL